jgi:hypothetical protein
MAGGKEAVPEIRERAARDEEQYSLNASSEN